MKRIRTDPDPEHWPLKGVIYTPVYLVVRGNSSPEGPDGGQVDVQHLEAILAQHVLNNVKKNCYSDIERTHNRNPYIP